jgi:vacuolar-type H+-ATPase subunit E/Vma4
MSEKRLSKAILDDMFETIGRTRDELKVQAHLAKADAKDEAKTQWQALERQWEHAAGKRKQLQDAAVETGEEVLEGIKISLDELREGYKRIRKLL